MTVQTRLIIALLAAVGVGALIAIVPFGGVSAEQAREDLQLLIDTLDERHAYRPYIVEQYGDVSGVRTLLDIPDKRMATPDLARRIQAYLADYGDGHTRVDPFDSAYLDPRCAPYLVGDAADGLVAFREDRRGFFDEDHPYLVAIDGVPVQKWIDAARPLVVAGSTQLVRTQSIRMLRRVAELRRWLALPDLDTCTVELASADGAAVERIVPLGPKPIYGAGPPRESRRLQGDIGYLRLPSMRRRIIGDMLLHMEQFADTRGLIIDVRGNRGGSRRVLLELFPYFLAPDEAPHVANVAAYRLGARRFRPGLLNDRFLYVADSPLWTPAQRAAVHAVAFAPAWTPPEDSFSPWHYLVLDRRERHRNLPHYDRPVVILMDDACFSATDVFLGAFQGRFGVWLLGTPSGGGSGRAVDLELPHSGIRVEISSMISFRPDGRLYDGAGIDPEILVRPIATDFIGRTDTQLDAAVKLLTAPGSTKPTSGASPAPSRRR